MARPEREFRAGADDPLSLAELLSLLGGAEADPQRRKDAIACYLSAGEGWHEAMKRLGGAFAAADAGLRDFKTD